MRSNVVQMSNKGLPSKDSIIINTEKKTYAEELLHVVSWVSIPGGVGVDRGFKILASRSGGFKEE